MIFFSIKNLYKSRRETPWLRHTQRDVSGHFALKSCDLRLQYVFLTRGTGESRRGLISQPIFNVQRVPPDALPYAWAADANHIWISKTPLFNKLSVCWEENV